MLYYFFDWLYNRWQFTGGRVFHYITVRAILATLLSLIITIGIGGRLIRYLRRKQIGESVRCLGLQDEQKKEGTVTMGGIIIIIGIVLPTLLFANINNIYILLMLWATLGFGAIGFIDDYIKVFRKNKKGLAGRLKIAGQVFLGLVIGLVLYFHKDATIYRQLFNVKTERKEIVSKEIGNARFTPVKSPVTTIPFIKHHEFNYSKILTWIHAGLEKYTWIIYLLVVVFITTAVSNSANLTDGLDGLASGVSAIIGACLGVFAYISGNFRFANYFDILFIPNLSELSIFIGAFVGAFVGFLWYNAYPAKIFMGDTGSLMAGGIIAALSFILRKELMIPIFCGIFFVESLSVILQVSYFRYTKKRYGAGQRIFLMSPLHHHYQKKGLHENKIVLRFWIIALLCAILSVLTIKIR